MAVVSATSNGATEDAEGSKAGWLSKKTQFTRRWRPAWFQINQSRLLYGPNEKTAAKTISLIGARVEALEDDGRFGWAITPKNSKRTFFLRAGSAEEQQEWMVAVCEAQIKSGKHASNACVVQ
ncbi:pleckstrin homology-like domain-containing protein [Colossoma macropomum]|uniref:pleckstrin homology-like domain-containing protein n=1 Tax=Colossoma macropomum TaxID=42526 RepID=UPI001863DAFD|nr:pleckstrin homology-like domain-containing protein [Colossoma macropomum]